MFHPNVRDEPSKVSFRTTRRVLLPLLKLSRMKRMTFLSILIIRTRDRSPPGGAFATEIFPISLSFVANFNKHTLVVNDPLVNLAVAIVFLAIRRPPSLPLEKSIHKKVQRPSQTANIVKARRSSRLTLLPFLRFNFRPNIYLNLIPSPSQALILIPDHHKLNRVDRSHPHSFDQRICHGR